jgi:hypothetical protein
MSNTQLPEPSASSLSEVVRFESVRKLSTLVAQPLRFVAFWAAVGLPFLYLPLLYGGLQGDRLLVFGGLIVANVAALLLGHDHRR